MKEIIKKEEFKNKLLETVLEIADVVCSTYGPNGSTVIITDSFTQEPYATKDGVSVMRSINFKDSVKNYIAKLIKQVANQTLDVAGDGTTTSICLTASIIAKGFDLLSLVDGKEPTKVYNKRQILEELDKLLETVVKHLEKNSKKLNKKDIYHVASISSNNDEKIAKIVTDAFNHSDVVKVEEGNSFEDKLEKVDGMKLLTTYFDQAFINNGSKYNIEYEEPHIILIDGKMHSLECISPIINKLSSRPIVIFADHFEDKVVSILKDNYNRGALQVALVKAPGVGNFRKNVMQDISKYTGASLLNPANKYSFTSYIGSISSIQINKENTILFNKEENLNVKDRIKELEEYSKSDELNDNEVDLVKQRIEQLKGSTSIIKVGGKSDVEIKERLDRIDDAVRAVSCALEEGIIEGGGVSLAKASLQCTDNIFEDILLEPYRFLNEPIKDSKIIELDLGRDMFKEHIIDPLKVTRTALENAVSVSKVLLSTEAIVLNEQEWKH